MALDHEIVFVSTRHTASKEVLIYASPHNTTHR
jgi:hypothetical protein